MNNNYIKIKFLNIYHLINKINKYLLLFNYFRLYKKNK